MKKEIETEINFEEEKENHEQNENVIDFDEIEIERFPKIQEV